MAADWHEKEETPKRNSRFLTGRFELEAVAGRFDPLAGGTNKGALFHQRARTHHGGLAHLVLFGPARQLPVAGDALQLDLEHAVRGFGRAKDDLGHGAFQERRHSNSNCFAPTA